MVRPAVNLPAPKACVTMTWKVHGLELDSRTRRIVTHTHIVELIRPPATRLLLLLVFEGRSFPCGWRRPTKSCPTSLDWPAAYGLMIPSSSSALMTRQRHHPTRHRLDPTASASHALLAGRRPKPSHTTTATCRPWTPPAQQVLISHQLPRHHMTRQRPTPARQPQNPDPSGPGCAAQTFALEPPFSTDRSRPGGSEPGFPRYGRSGCGLPTNLSAFIRGLGLHRLTSENYEWHPAWNSAFTGLRAPAAPTRTHSFHAKGRYLRLGRQRIWHRRPPTRRLPQAPWHLQRELPASTLRTIRADCLREIRPPHFYFRGSRADRDRKPRGVPGPAAEHER